MVPRHGTQGAPGTFAAPLLGAAPPRYPLNFHGGRVMHTSTTYAVFWAPPGYTFPSNYETLINRYLSDVAADSNQRTNVYSSDTQYYDNPTGHIKYVSHFGRKLDDQTPFPSSGCTPQTAGHVCLTDHQLQSEVNAVRQANGLPTGVDTLYVLFTPSGVDSCGDATSRSCSFNAFCAYHSQTNANPSTTVLYANQPFPDLGGCDSGQHPNGDASADSQISLISHEHNEAITDPLGDAWYDDVQGNENGDNCNFTFGAALGGLIGAQYNQVIGVNHYWLQEEWSNTDSACVQRYPNHAPQPRFFASPSSPAPGQAVSFDASGSSDPDGEVQSYTWNFGDGASASGAQVAHAYHGAGTFTATLTVGDDLGQTAGTAQPVTVNQASPPPTPSPPAPPPAPTFALTPTPTAVPTPRVTSLSVSPVRFRAASRGGSVARALTGATVRYRLATVARTTFTVKAAAIGHRRGRTCVAGKPTKGGKRCTRYLLVGGSFAQSVAAGGHQVRFTGRLSGKKLKPGAYLLLATPTMGTTAGPTMSTSFRIVA